MTGTDGGVRPMPSPVFGVVEATEQLFLTTAPLGTWLPVVGAEVTLPEAGTYRVTAQVQGQITQLGPASHAQVINLHTRMFDVTGNMALGSGELIPICGYTHPSAGIGLLGAYATQHDFVQVTGPTVIRLEGSINTSGADTRADPCRIFHRRTALLYERIAS